MNLLFDFADAMGGAGCRRAYTNPLTVLEAHTPSEVRDVLAAVDRATRHEGLHAAGFLTYEAAPAFDRAFVVRAGHRLPLAWFALFRGYDTSAPAPDVVCDPPASWSIDVTPAEYEQAIARIRDAIAEGRTYQVNLSARLQASFAGDVRSWYEELRRAQGAGYHALLELDNFAILSASPELFFARRGGEIVTRPMKGTRPRGRYREEDCARADELRQAEKDRAENLMIVDLLRSDLGRIAETGSVDVTALYQLERYPTVWQLTSAIRARLPRACGLADIFGALFPCGSVTGAPKISTMQIIAELERSPREVYCGAIGVVEPCGDCTFSVPIRTAWLDRTNNVVEYGTGSGVVWDSVASVEFDELRAKAAILAESRPHFDLLETMRLEDGAYRRTDRHLARLASSAAYFGYPFCYDDIRAALADVGASYPQGAWRVRLLLSAEGSVRVEPHALEPETPPAQPFDLACNPVHSTDRFLFHKTTHRAVYDRALDGRSDLFDVLLWNERGELTEFTRGNVVLELDGQRLTPPRTAGLLAGTFRAELLDTQQIREATLMVSDLARATRVWLINSVRGVVEVKRGGAGEKK
jgi:para-aminobenzoate synthetase / 4-amino-4-deoxychorismate lyase